MINIFNRKKLFMTYSDTLQAMVRNALRKNGIPCTTDPAMRAFDYRAHAEYRIYVKRKDYFHADEVLQAVLRKYNDR